MSTKKPYVTTAKCLDGTFYGAVWNADDSLLAMSQPLPTRGMSRQWAVKVLKQAGLKADFAVLLKAGLTQADALEVLHDHGDKYPGHAADVATDDELEVDDKPLYSRGGDPGVWVGAWVWVPDPETP